MASDMIRSTYHKVWWAFMLRGLFAIALGVIILWRPIDSIAIRKLERNKGKSTFSNVTSQLTTLTYINATTGQPVTVSLFDPSLQDFFWNYQNNGLRLAQLRFYPLQ